MDRAAAQSLREVQQLMRSMGTSNINDLQRMLSHESRLLSDAGREQVRINQQTGKATHALHAAELKEVQKSAREQVQIAERTARESASSYEKHLGAGFFRSLASKSANAFKTGISTLTGGSGVGGGSGGFLPGLTNISEIIQGLPQIGQLAGALTRPLTSAAEAGVKFNAFMETSKIGFETLLGSEEKAVAHLAELQRFANTTPFQFEDLVGASQRMQAFGFSARDIIPTLTAVGDAVSSTGAISKESLDGVLLALGQMKTKGKVSAEEMNQLAERGIPAWDLLAKAIGKTVAQTQKLATAGQLNGGAAVQAIAAQMEAKYGGQMERVSNTFTGRMSNLEDIRQQAQGKATENLTRDISDTVGAALQRGDVASSLAASINMAISPVSGLIKTAAVGLLGGGITSGLTEGIAAGKGAVLNAAMDLGLGSIEALASSIGAHSPAVKFIELGEFAGQGFEIGLMNSTRRAFVNFEKLTKEQIENARKVIEIGQQRGANDKQIRSAVSTAIVESRLRNLNYGDRDSLGIMQQRPSVRGRNGQRVWGTASQVSNVDYAINRFYDFAMKRSQSGTVGQLAQRVQGSAFPLRYDQALPEADRIIAHLVGTSNALPVRVVGGDMGAPTAADNAYTRNKMLVRPHQREDYGGRDPFQMPDWAKPKSALADVAAFALPVGSLLTSVQQIDGLLPDIPRVFDESARAAEKAHLVTSYILDDVVKTGAAGNAVADSLNKADQAAGAWAGRVIQGGNKANDIFKELSKNSEQVLVGAFTKAKGGIMGIFHDIGAGWWQMIKQMAAEAVAAKLTKLLFGATKKDGGETEGSGAHGLFGKISASLFKGGKSNSTAITDSTIKDAATDSLLNSGGRVGGAISNASSFAGATGSTAMSGASAFAAPSALAALGGGGGAAAAGGAGAAGAGGAGAGAGGFGSLVPFLTNPWTIGIAAAAVGGILLWRHFRNGTEKALRKTIQQEYGISVKDMAVLKQVKELGESTFGKGHVRQHLHEVVKLESVKELLANYAQSTGQKTSLVTDKQLGDPAFGQNQFIKRLTGGLIPGTTRGFDYLPLLADGGEHIINAQATARVGVHALDSVNAGQAVIVPRSKAPIISIPSGDSYGGSGRTGSEQSSGIPTSLIEALHGAMERQTEAMQEHSEFLSRLKPTAAGKFLEVAAKENPRAVMNGLNSSLKQGHGKTELQRNLNL
jgi:tape measure domain-containing protein